MSKYDELSVYLCYLLRHHPEDKGLNMDVHGWVDIDELISKLDNVTRDIIDEIVATDKKGRYKIKDNKIKCCQGHSIPWVEPELEYKEPPKYIYHGTTTVALDKIYKSGHISKMARHAVHTHADVNMAWKSAKRWNLIPVVLKIDAESMYNDGYKLGVSENQVWCVDEIPIQYIVDTIYK